ncbi:serine/threonine-protein kinase PknH/PknJ [Mycolicibacillus trivialis]
MAGVGSVIAGYRVERVLGTGGMGTVYLVANPELPRRDALKVLSAGLSRDPKFRSRFIREADVASQLDHPNIVSIYRRGATADGLLWIAMQFVDGVNADEAARAAGRMEPRRAIHIVGEVGKALDYAHRRGVIHRDVKPANVLLSGPVGPEERVLLGDFGIARALDDVGLTGTGGVMATVSYAAPEVIAGNRVDGRADLYSLGCTLFRLLTGRSPFEAAGAQAAVMMAHLHSPPPRVSEVAPWLPPSLDAVLAKALAKDPAQRFGSAAELAGAAAAALQQAAPNAPTAVQPWQQPQMQPFTGAMSAPARRNRAGLIVAALAAVVLVVVAGITAILLAGDKDSPAAATPTSPGATTTASPTSAPTSTSASESPTPGGTEVPVPVSALNNLLLDPGQMSSTLGSPPLSVVNDETRMWADTIVDKDCDSVVIVNGQSDYAGSGYTAIHWQGLKDNPDDWSWDVGQTVVSFPRADDAADYVARTTDVWKKCANRTINVRASQDSGAPDALWNIGPVSDGGGILSTTRIPQSGGNWMCQEALSARNNIAIRVWLCHGDADMLLVRKLVDAIGAKVDAQS